MLVITEFSGVMPSGGDIGGTSGAAALGPVA